MWYNRNCVYWRFNQKVFFFLDIKQQVILVWGQKTHLILSIFICSSISCGMYFELWKGTCLPITWYCFSSGKLLASSCEELAYNLAKDILLVAFLIGNKHRFPCSKSWHKKTTGEGKIRPAMGLASQAEWCSFKAWMCGRLPLRLPDSTLAMLWSRI